MPLVMPITEPAVGYGAAGGLAFISQPFGAAAQGLGRPDVTFIGGFGTENGSWGVFAMDMRHWLDDRVQTIVGGIYASVNLDFHGIGKDSVFSDNPVRYNLNPKGGMANVRYRFGDSLFWAGLGYMFARMDVSVDAPEDRSRLPNFDDATNIGGLTLAGTYDTRDNFFTPTRGVYLEASFSPYGKLLGGDDTFERLSLIGIQYAKLPFAFYLGARNDVMAALGDAPFFMNGDPTKVSLVGMDVKLEDQLLIDPATMDFYDARFSQEAKIRVAGPNGELPVVFSVQRETDVTN